jgi:hypothetical protein
MRQSKDRPLSFAEHTWQATPQQGDKTMLNIKKQPGIPQTYFLMTDFIMFSQP